MPLFKKLEMTEPERARILDKLDTAEQKNPKGPRRDAARLEYRVRDIPFSVNHPGGGVGRYIVLARNLSTGGISLLHAGYLYCGTECRLALTMPRGGAKTMIGKVVFCRLVAGQIHEIGVQFMEKIDLAEFAAPSQKRLSDDPEVRAAMQPLSGNALLVTTSGAERKLLQTRLKQSGLNPTAVDRAGAAVDQIKLLPYTVVVCELALPAPGAGELVQTLRRSGYTGAVVGIAAEESPVEYQRAIDAGMHGCIMKPIKHDAMHQVLMKAMRDAGCKMDDGGPIVSSLATDPASGELVQFFISHAKEAASAIVGAIKKNDLAAVRKECHSLKSIAGGYGFQSVAEAARQAVTNLDATMSIEESMPQVQGVLNVCGRLTAEKMPESKAA